MTKQCEIQHLNRKLRHEYDFRYKKVENLSVKEGSLLNNSNVNEILAAQPSFKYFNAKRSNEQKLHQIYIRPTIGWKPECEENNKVNVIKMIDWIDSLGVSSLPKTRSVASMIITINLIAAAVTCCLLLCYSSEKSFEAIQFCHSIVAIMSFTFLCQVIGFYGQKREDFDLYLTRYDQLKFDPKWIGCLDAESDINFPRLHESVQTHSWHYTRLYTLIFTIISSVIFYILLALCLMWTRACTAFTGHINIDVRVELDFFTTGYIRYN